MTFREESIGGQRLILGDCLEVMPTLGRVDAVVTDPPYGIGAANGANTGGTDASGRYKRKPRQYDGAWDDDRPPRQAIEALTAAADLQIIWGGNFFPIGCQSAGAG